MERKTISLTDDAYERLLAEKRSDESVSDVVRRLTDGGSLEAYHGAVSDETGDELEAIVSRRRNERGAHVERLVDAFER